MLFSHNFLVPLTYALPALIAAVWVSSFFEIRWLHRVLCLMMLADSLILSGGAVTLVVKLGIHWSATAWVHLGSVFIFMWLAFMTTWSSWKGYIGRTIDIRKDRLVVMFLLCLIVIFSGVKTAGNRREHERIISAPTVVVPTTKVASN